MSPLIPIRPAHSPAPSATGSVTITSAFISNTSSPSANGILLKGLYRWTPLQALEAWDTIMGFQFENLVLNNLEAIRKKADANVPVVNAGPYWQEKTLRREACQIDLLVRTSRSLTFETRLRQKIDASVIDEVKEKVRRLKLPRDLSVRTGLIYHGQSWRPAWWRPTISITSFPSAI